MSTNPTLITARNRANAAHSTGPKTEADKKRSCLNAMRHGLPGHTIVLPAEDLDAYQNFTKQFFDDLKPVGILEKQLVQSLVDTSWRLNRIPALENNCSPSASPHEIRAFAALSMHGQRLSRQFEKTLKQLRELQSERRQLSQTRPLPESGFVFSNTATRPASWPVSLLPDMTPAPLAMLSFEAPRGPSCGKPSSSLESMSLQTFGRMHGR